GVGTPNRRSRSGPLSPVPTAGAVLIAASTSDRSPSGSSEGESERSPSSGVGRADGVLSEKSYPQLRQRSTSSNPRYAHFGHFMRDTARARSIGVCSWHTLHGVLRPGRNGRKLGEREQLT